MDYNDASLFLVEMMRSKTLDDDSLIQFYGLVDDELFEKGVDYFIKRKGVRYHLIKLIVEKCSDSLFEKALDGISKEDIDGHLLSLIFRMRKEKYFDDVMRLIEKRGVYDSMMVTTLLANGKMDTFEKHYEDFIKSDRILGLIVPAVLEKTDDINLQKRVIEDTIKNNNFTSLTLSNLLSRNESKEIIKFALDKLIEKRYIISMYSLKKIYQNHKDYFDIFLNAFIENGTDRPDIEFLCSTDTSDENILRLLRKLYPEGYLARMRNIEFSKDLEYVLDYRPKLFGKASRVIIDSGIKNAEQFERLAYRTGKIYEIFSVIIENRLKITPDIFSIFGFTLTDKKLIEMILNYIIEYGYFSYRLYDDFLYYQNKHKKLISKLTHAIVSWRLVDERYLNIAIKRQNDEAKKLFKENMNETPKNKDFEELEMFMKQFV